MQKTTVVRLVDGRLAWYPPGASQEPQWLDDDNARDNLRSALSQRKVGVCFAVPGMDVRLLSLEVDPGERKHIAASLPFTLEEQVAEDIDDLHFSSCVLDKETLGVAICSRERMDAWQALLADFSGILRWCPEPLLLPWKTGEWCLVLEGSEAIVRVDQCEGFTIERDLVSPMLAAAAMSAEPEAIVVYGTDQQADTQLLPEALRERVQWRQGNLYAALLLGESGEVDLNMRQGDYAPRLPLG
ncbi:MAG: type II secretion system protein GspL, partial [Halioglobus sp.]